MFQSAYAETITLFRTFLIVLKGIIALQGLKPRLLAAFKYEMVDLEPNRWN
jgi:hypothetical protein